MVAVANSPLEDVSVIIAAGDEASGLSQMVGQYLEQLLADSAEKRAGAAMFRGRLGLQAREGDVAVTIVFGDAGVVVEEGLQAPDAVVAGEIEQLMHMLAGRANPAWQIVRGKVAVRPTLRSPLFGYRAYRMMRLPEAHVWSGLPRQGIALAAGAVAMTLALLVVAKRSRRRGGDNG